MQNIKFKTLTSSVCDEILCGCGFKPKDAVNFQQFSKQWTSGTQKFLSEGVSNLTKCDLFCN